MMPDQSPLVSGQPYVSPEFWERRFACRDDVRLATLEGESVLLNLENGVYYSLNRIGTVVWELLKKDQSLEAVLTAVCDRYDVPEEVARADVAELVTHLRDEKLVVERR
jgi:hypothetical protein